MNKKILLILLFILELNFVFSKISKDKKNSFSSEGFINNLKIVINTKKNSLYLRKKTINLAGEPSLWAVHSNNTIRLPSFWFMHNNNTVDLSKQIKKIKFLSEQNEQIENFFNFFHYLIKDKDYILYLRGESFLLKNYCIKGTKSEKNSKLDKACIFLDPKKKIDRETKRKFFPEYKFNNIKINYL